jgi:hypothetical protein
MLFFSGRTRNSLITVDDRSFTHKLGHSCAILGCLLAVTGLVVIVVGAISETKTTTFIGIGIISLGAGLLLTMLIGFYAKLDICYNNWIYRSRVIPVNMETTRSTANAIEPRNSIVVSPLKPSLTMATT